MAKILSLLSIVALSTPLIMISCSQGVETKESNIEIDRTKLESNFIKTNQTFGVESIDQFVVAFNKAPQNYFVSPINTPLSSVTPFITANVEHFMVDDKTKKPIMSAESIPNIVLPSFKTVKFTFKLKPEYQPLIISPIDFPKPYEFSTFSMQFRSELPEINGPSRKNEIDWIQTFFKTDNNVVYISKEIEKDTESKIPQDVVLLITDKSKFESIFEFNIPFPNKTITGWDFEVSASIPPNDDFPKDSITLNFKLLNSLFTGDNALTSEESTVSFVLSGFKVPKV